MRSGRRAAKAIALVAYIIVILVATPQAQQSASFVQLWPSTLHVSPQRRSFSLPGAGVHGSPQQSALEAHGMPVYTDGSVQSSPAPVQRGMPRLS